jgi:filamentous hemagglutinin
LTPEARWTAVEQRLGKNLPGNFRTIDKFEDGLATSIKSLDLGAKSYANPSSLTRVVQGYIDKMAAYRGAKWSDIKIQPAEIKGRALDLAIPPDGSEAQRASLQTLIEYGKEHGVIVNIVEMW